MALAFASSANLLLRTPWSTAPKSVHGKDDTEHEVAAVVTRTRQTDPSVAHVIDLAAGNADFPKVGEGAVCIGEGGTAQKHARIERDTVAAG